MDKWQMENLKIIETIEKYYRVYQVFRFFAWISLVLGIGFLIYVFIVKRRKGWRLQLKKKKVNIMIGCGCFVVSLLCFGSSMFTNQRLGHYLTKSKEEYKDTLAGPINSIIRVNMVTSSESSRNDTYQAVASEIECKEKNGEVIILFRDEEQIQEKANKSEVKVAPTDLSIFFKYKYNKKGDKDSAVLVPINKKDVMDEAKRISLKYKDDPLDGTIDISVDYLKLAPEFKEVYKKVPLIRKWIPEKEVMVNSKG